MKYKGNPEYKPDSPSCTGILLTNLGTPDAPTPAALRTYLAEFLSDPRVVEVPRLLWWFALHGVILRTRPKRSAELYKKVWTEEGSPLLSISKKQVEGIQNLLTSQFSGSAKVELAMRYGNPSIAAALEKLRAVNAKRILILPLYPQYSAATTASTFDAIADVLKTWRSIPEIRMVNNYYEDDGYITAIANSIEQYWQNNSKAKKLLFSFHGLPKDYVDAGDSYFDECHATANLIAEKMNLKKEEWIITFQSRFGPREWLKPYTDKTLKSLAKEGIKSINVVCPGFSADCLETLEEINMQNRGFFLDAGGEDFSYIPALNENEEHLQALSNIVMKHCRGWDN